MEMIKNYDKEEEGDPMKKRRILACAVLLASLSMGAYGTYAYFTSDVIVTNVITSGNVKIELRETELSDGKEIPFTNKTGILPGKQISKIVKVENTGDHPAYIRIKVGKEIHLADGVDGEPDLSLITCDFNEMDWEEKDGYYYYKEPLKPGKTTEALFEQVTFDRTMGNMYQNSKAEINVYAQATQVIHNGDSAMDAKGWPEENKE